jgi:predicted O-methyltransferase YrrM
LLGARSIFRRLIGAIAFPFIAVTAPLFAIAARTGIGVGICRRFGFHPLRVHFYQPVPEYESVPPEYFSKRQTYAGFDIDETSVRVQLERLAPFGAECDWPMDASAPGGYYAGNGNFGFTSAALLHAMLRCFGSRRVVEIGGGYSTLISLNALERNGGGALTCVEPYPVSWLERRLVDAGATLLRSKAQEVALNRFDELEAGDLLFIDSSHVSKLASDVNFLFLQVLPRLKPGVLVHIHDIYLPYEYPAEHFFGSEKIFWNEQYLLQAFLTLNREFEILVPGYLVQTDMCADLRRTFANFDPEKHRKTSSFWMRRRREAI